MKSDIGQAFQAIALCLTTIVVWWAAIAYAPMVMAWWGGAR